MRFSSRGHVEGLGTRVGSRVTKGGEGVYVASHDDIARWGNAPRAAAEDGAPQPSNAPSASAKPVSLTVVP